MKNLYLSNVLKFAPVWHREKDRVFYIYRGGIKDTTIIIDDIIVKYYIIGKDLIIVSEQG